MINPAYGDVNVVKLCGYEGNLNPVTTCVVDGVIKVIAGYDNTFSSSFYVKDSENEQNTIRVWDLQTGKCEHLIPIAKRFDSVFSFKQNQKNYIGMGFMDGVIIFL